MNVDPLSVRNGGERRAVNGHRYGFVIVRESLPMFTRERDPISNEESACISLLYMEEAAPNLSMLMREHIQSGIGACPMYMGQGLSYSR